jgi:hypothetical protein
MKVAARGCRAEAGRLQFRGVALGPEYYGHVYAHGIFGHPLGFDGGRLAGRHACPSREQRCDPSLSLLPGDFKYESADGRVKVYFPVVTSIVLSVVLTLVLKYMT